MCAVRVSVGRSKSCPPASGGGRRLLHAGAGGSGEGDDGGEEKGGGSTDTDGSSATTEAEQTEEPERDALPRVIEGTAVASTAATCNTGGSQTVWTQTNAICACKGTYPDANNAKPTCPDTMNPYGFFVHDTGYWPQFFKRKSTSTGIPDYSTLAASISDYQAGGAKVIAVTQPVMKNTMLFCSPQT